MLPPPLPSLCRPDEPIDKGLWLYARRPFGNKVNACTSSMEASGCGETIAFFISAARCHLIRPSLATTAGNNVDKTAF